MGGSVSKLKRNEDGQECSGHCGEFKAWDKFHMGCRSAHLNGRVPCCKQCLKDKRGNILRTCELDKTLIERFLKYGFLT